MLTRRQFTNNLTLGLPVTAAATTAMTVSTATRAATNNSAAFVSVSTFEAYVTIDAATNKSIWDEAFQRAVDTGKNVYIPPGTYTISQPIEVPEINPGQIIYSDGISEFGYASANIEMFDASVGALFLVKAHNVMFNNLVLRGAGSTSNTTGIKFEKDTNTDDVDGIITNCLILQFERCVEIYGRGLRAHNNLFASFKHGIEIHWPDNGVIANENETLQPLPYGMRAYYITDNRIHSGLYFIKQISNDPNDEDECPWGMVVNNNLIDIGNGLYYGGAKYSNFTGNVICHTNGPILRFDRPCISTVISNNVFSGTDDHALNNSGEGIWFTSNCEHVVISSNTFSHLGKSGIVFDGDDQSYNTITGNTFNDIGWINSNVRGCIGIYKKADNFAITGNSFIATNPGVANMIRASAIEIGGFQVIGNVYDKTKNLFSTDFIDTGNNNILP